LFHCSIETVVGTYVPAHNHFGDGRSGRGWLQDSVGLKPRLQLPDRSSVSCMTPSCLVRALVTDRPDHHQRHDSDRFFEIPTVL
jgi:hypothetical protein